MRRREIHHATRRPGDRWAARDVRADPAQKSHELVSCGTKPAPRKRSFTRRWP